jgi:hypothetical protein
VCCVPSLGALRQPARTVPGLLERSSSPALIRCRRTHRDAWQARLGTVRFEVMSKPTPDEPEEETRRGSEQYGYLSRIASSWSVAMPPCVKWPSGWLPKAWEPWS